MHQIYFNKKPLITIVTVVFNGGKEIEQTILSVTKQTYKNIEYIIIDGCSSDETLAIIQKYHNKISHWISEKDSGIYDAMNKAIDLSNGEWIAFMNAGDSFYSNDTLEKIFNNEQYKEIDIVYGNHQILYKSGLTKLKKVGPVLNLNKGSQFCHQSSFIRASYHKKNQFNIDNKIAADFEFFYKAWKKKITFFYIDLCVSKFKAGGISDLNRIKSIISQWRIVDKNYKNNIYYIYLIVRESLKKIFFYFLR